MSAYLPFGAAKEIFCLCGMAYFDAGMESELVSLMSQRGFDFANFAQVAANHCLLPAIAPAIKRPAFARVVPEEIAVFASETYDRNAARNLNLRTQVFALARTLGKTGIVPVVLKGGAALAQNKYADPALRFLIDLDLYVPASELQPALTAMSEAGYRIQPSEDWGPYRYYRCLHPDAAAPVEVSCRLPAVRAMKRDVEDEIVARALLLTEDGEQIKVLDNTGQAFVQIIHGALGHSEYTPGAVQLRFLFDFALSSSSLSAAELEEVRVAAKRCSAERAAVRFIEQAQIFFGCRISGSALNGLEVDERLARIKRIVQKQTMLRPLRYFASFYADLSRLLDRQAIQDRYRCGSTEAELLVCRCRAIFALFLKFCDPRKAAHYLKSLRRH